MTIGRKVWIRLFRTLSNCYFWFWMLLCLNYYKLCFRTDRSTRQSHAHNYQQRFIISRFSIWRPLPHLPPPHPLVATPDIFSPSIHRWELFFCFWPTNYFWMESLYCITFHIDFMLVPIKPTLIFCPVEYQLPRYNICFSY